MQLDKNVIEKIAAGDRIPKQFRNDKISARILLNAFEGHNEILLRPDIAYLKRWSLGSGTKSVAAVVSVEHVGPCMTYDLSVPDGHSYVANGIVCHNTTNLPNDISVEQVKELYMTGWEVGCKGVTIYRDGCRDAVMSKGSVDDIEFVEHHAPRRSNGLPCEIHRTTIKNEEWTIFVGLMDDKPYEVFGGLSSLVEIPKKYTTGKITKRNFKQGGKYDLLYGDAGDETKIKDIVSVFDNPDYSFATRLLSTMLRHGTPVQYVVEQLQKDKFADLFSFAKVMARTLKKYITDGTETHALCLSCGASGTMMYQGGCTICASCGSEICG